MIPGEVIPADGEIVLNGDRTGPSIDRSQHRRPADPGGQPLSFRRR